MVIGIDGNEANVEVKVGIGEYAYELLAQFAKIKDQRSKIKFSVYLKDAPRPEMPKQSDNWEYVIVKPRKLWTQIGLPIYLFTHFPRPDVFFTPSHYGPRFSPVPTAISIMDLSYVHFQELFNKHDLYQLTNWTRYSARNAKKVFTISNYSKDAIIKEYKKKPQDVIVTYPGIRSGSSIMKQELSKKQLNEKYGISDNYILFVGTLQPRKNIVRLIEAFSMILRGPVAHHSQKSLRSHSFTAGTFRGSPSRATPTSNLPENTQLVVVGKKGWLYEEILAAPEKFGVKESVKFLDFVPTEDLPSLYRHALCYVLPSLYEGFGLPVLEAMKYGCPVVTSNVSSLPEAGGDAALYFDPENVEDIAEKIKEVISSEKLRKDMKEKGYEHIKKFSWEKAAKETLEVLEDLGGK